LLDVKEPPPPQNLAGSGDLNQPRKWAPHPSFARVGNLEPQWAYLKSSTKNGDRGRHAPHSPFFDSGAAAAFGFGAGLWAGLETPMLIST